MQLLGEVSQQQCLVKVLCIWQRKSGLPKSKGVFRMCSSRLAALKLWKLWQLQLRVGLLRFVDSLLQSRHSQSTSLCFSSWLFLEPRTLEIWLRLLGLNWAVPTQWGCSKVRDADVSRACSSSAASQSCCALSCNMRCGKVMETSASPTA